MSQYESLEIFIYIMNIIWGQFENEFDFFRKSYRILLTNTYTHIVYDNIILSADIVSI